MARPTFKTLPDELLDDASKVIEYFRHRGFSVQLEPNILGFPYTPTMLCKRGVTTKIVELYSEIRMDRLDQWVQYGKSCSRDTRVVLCLPSIAQVSGHNQATLRQKGVGLLAILEDGPIEQIPAADLGLNVSLPPLASFPQRLRTLLGPAYEQFDQGQWREGFQDACLAVETEARRYLKKWSKTGRIKVIRKGVPVTLASNKIDKLTLGQLAVTFSSIQSQSHTDSLIEQALATINEDRVNVTHRKGKYATEKKLRTNVGQHMWTIIAALKLMGQ